MTTLDGISPWRKEEVGTRDVLSGMMTADDVAEVVVFVLTRPRNHRILETAFRPMREASSE